MQGEHITAQDMIHLQFSGQRMIMLNDLSHHRADSLLERARGLAVTEEQVQVTPGSIEGIFRFLIYLIKGF